MHVSYRRWGTLLCLFGIFFPLRRGVSSDQEMVHRVIAQQLVGDFKQAIEECRKGIEQYPHSMRLKKMWIELLSSRGQIREALTCFHKWEISLQEKRILEAIAWGVIEHCEDLSEWIVPAAILQSIAAIQDVRVVSLLCEYLHHSHSLVREIAVRIASQYRDKAIAQTLHQLLRSEKNWFVRIQVIRSLGAVQAREAIDDLLQMATSSRGTPQERAAAVESLVYLYEESEKEIDLSKLFLSNWGALRYFGCQLASHLDRQPTNQVIRSLLTDSLFFVRIGMLNTLYLLGIDRFDPSIREEVQKRLEDPNPFVRATASWVTLWIDREKGIDALMSLITRGENRVVQRFAAAALSHSGFLHPSLFEELVRLNRDPFVRVNLAIGLIKYDRTSLLPFQEIHLFLQTTKQKIAWENTPNPLIQPLGPTDLFHHPQMPSYPLAMDQLTRFNLLGLLMRVGDQQAKGILREWLMKPLVEGVTEMAAWTLFEEGDQEMFSSLLSLLKDPSDLVRVQAAFVLAIVGREEEALPILHDAYQHVDKRMKMNILGALGMIGSTQSIPFLLDRIKEPFRICNVLAAAALLQCLYR